MTNISLYGIGGADDSYRVLKYWKFFQDNVTISDIIHQAVVMMGAYPSIKQVYAIDGSSELYWDFKKTIKNPSVENNVVFKSVLEKCGILVTESNYK